MPRIDEETSIDRPVREVFAIVSDPESDPRWRAEVRSVELLSGEPRAPGAVYRQRVGIPGGVATTVVELLEVQPDRAVTFAVHEPVQGRGGYVLQAEGSGTRVRFWVELPSSGGLRALAGRVVAAGVARGARADLAGLRTLLERAGG